MMDFQEVTKQIQGLSAQYLQVNAAVEAEHAEVNQAKQCIESISEAQLITQHIAEELQRKAHERIAKVVTRCLVAVFDDPYEFNIRFEKKRGKTEAVLEFTRDGEVYSDPLNEVGGGVVDVATLALRLACVMVSRPAMRRTFVLDEPWSNVRGRDNRKRTRQVLSVLAEEFGVQWILNTDIPDYCLGKIVEME